ncbi:unnamed protein product [Mytilus coruscus]|uniref:Reverse transcriptase domain-containing protein n=1 Tax=Mytilus coruscus TaxID=42192 RepID=A0A6J8B6S3_MYTCO|nr:unnamed protein product [Mytilus coruscus]
MWIKLQDKLSKTDVLYSCVCYLPPIDSTRACDANEFYDMLISQIQIYGKDSFFLYICGDLKSRCSALVTVIYKIYCNILNNRLVFWEEERGVLNYEQNVFRKGLSTIDHISTLTSIIECRKLKRMSTYAAFIDFKKAYDSINRQLLFIKLNDLGINGTMFNALRSLYNDVRSCVRVNGFSTDWFSVNCELKQG